MAEHVVKHVRLLQIILLAWRADEAPGGKAAIGQMIEKQPVGHQPRHCHHLPPGRLHQSVGQRVETRDARLVHPQYVQPRHEFRHHPPRQHARLPLEQPVPHRMVGRAVAIPVLRNGPVLRGVRGTVERGFGVRGFSHGPSIANRARNCFSKWPIIRV